MDWIWSRDGLEMDQRWTAGYGVEIGYWGWRARVQLLLARRIAYAYMYRCKGTDAASLCEENRICVLVYM